MTSSERLLVVSHVVHYEWEDQIWSYTPYVAELALWAELFDHVTVASPTRQGPPTADCSAVPARNLHMAPMAETGGPGLLAKLRQAILAPVMCVRLLLLMRQADVVHVRCPGNLGLLGVLVAPLSRRNRIAKYAGQWSGYPAEARTYRLQRQILRSSWWAAPVTVYGRNTSDPPHVIGFFTSAISAAQIERGANAAARREWKPPLRVLFVGRLTAARSADVVIEGIARAAEAGVDVRLQIVGEGPEADRLREQASRSNQADRVIFSGALPFDAVLSAYEASDVLVLVSQTEGFGKAASEAMAFGLVVIGSDSGYLQTLLADDRGILVRPGDPAAVDRALQAIAARPEHYRLVGKRAAEWAEPYSLEGLQDGIAEIMREAWGYSRPDNRAREFIAPPVALQHGGDDGLGGEALLDRILEVVSELGTQLSVTQQSKNLVGEGLFVAWGHHPHAPRHPSDGPHVTYVAGHRWQSRSAVFQQRDRKPFGKGEQNAYIAPGEHLGHVGPDAEQAHSIGDSQLGRRSEDLAHHFVICSAAYAQQMNGGSDGRHPCDGAHRAHMVLLRAEISHDHHPLARCAGKGIRWRRWLSDCHEVWEDLNLLGRCTRSKVPLTNVLAHDEDSVGQHRPQASEPSRALLESWIVVVPDQYRPAAAGQGKRREVHAGAVSLDDVDSLFGDEFAERPDRAKTDPAAPLEARRRHRRGHRAGKRAESTGGAERRTFGHVGETVRKHDGHPLRPSRCQSVNDLEDADRCRPGVIHD